MQNKVREISEVLENSNIFPMKMVTSITAGGITFESTTKDSMGNSIQEWFGHWLTKNGFFWHTPKHTQAFPDFTLDNDNEQLEVKSYNSAHGPGFDIAKFPGLVNDLVYDSEILDADFIVFSYIHNHDGFSIDDFRIRKIWEICYITRQGLIGSQQRQGTIIAIRPYHKLFGGVSPISSKREFIEILAKTLDFYGTQIIKEDSEFVNGNDWIEKVESNYLIKNGESL